MNETVKAYIAGIIDGEGSIIINSRRHHSTLIVEVGNTDPEMIDFLQQNCGGGVSTYYQKSPKAKRVFFMWRIQSKQAELILREIVPYLITKRKHALVGLKLRDIINSRVPKPVCTPLTNEEKQGRFDCYSELKEINFKRQGTLISDLKYTKVKDRINLGE